MKRILNHPLTVAHLLGFLLAFGVTLAYITPARAGEQFVIAGGGGAAPPPKGAGSTYSAMIGDIAEQCSTPEMPIAEMQTSGGPQNLQLLKDGKVDGAMLPSDLLFAAKLDNPASVAQIRGLFPLHNEEIHAIARADVKKEGGVNVPGFGNVGGDKVEFKTLEDLKGRNVGAVGGSVVSANIINDLMGIGYKVVSYTSNQQLFAALTSGSIDAAIISAGAPSGAVAGLPANRFRFLPVRLNDKLAQVYTPTKIQYENVSSNRPVDTIQSPAIMASRVFRSKERLEGLAQLKACYTANLTKIQDKKGSHPKWQDVELNPSMKWPVAQYDLPPVSVQVNQQSARKK